MLFFLAEPLTWVLALGGATATGLSFLVGTFGSVEMSFQMILVGLALSIHAPEPTPLPHVPPGDPGPCGGVTVFEVPSEQPWTVHNVLQRTEEQVGCKPEEETWMSGAGADRLVLCRSSDESEPDASAGSVILVTRGPNSGSEGPVGSKWVMREPLESLDARFVYRDGVLCLDLAAEVDAAHRPIAASLRGLPRKIRITGGVRLDGTGPPASLDEPSF